MQTKFKPPRQGRRVKQYRPFQKMQSPFRIADCERGLGGAQQALLVVRLAFQPAGKGVAGLFHGSHSSQDLTKTRVRERIRARLAGAPVP